MKNCNSARILFPNAPNSQKQLVNNSRSARLVFARIETFWIHINPPQYEPSWKSWSFFFHSFLSSFMRGCVITRTHGVGSHGSKGRASLLKSLYMIKVLSRNVTDNNANNNNTRTHQKVCMMKLLGAQRQNNGAIQTTKVLMCTKVRHSFCRSEVEDYVAWVRDSTLISLSMLLRK
jgi:hypothetical protein